MNTKNITKTIIQSLFLIVLFISPFAIDKINLLSAETNVTLLFPYKIAFENPVFFVFYLLPVFSIFLIVSIFLKKDFSKLSSLLFFLGLTIYIIFCVTITIFNATTVRWFLSIPWYIYLNFAISIITHSTIAIIELKRIRKNNPNYLEYKTIRESEKSAIKAYKQQQLQQNKKDKIVFSHMELKDINLGNGIFTTKGISLHTLSEFKDTLQGHYHTPGKYGKNIYIIQNNKEVQQIFADRL